MYKEKKKFFKQNVQMNEDVHPSSFVFIEKYFGWSQRIAPR